MLYIYSIYFVVVWAVAHSSDLLPPEVVKCRKKATIDELMQILWYLVVADITGNKSNRV